VTASNQGKNRLNENRRRLNYGRVICTDRSLVRRAQKSWIPLNGAKSPKALSVAEMARLYNVNQPTISRIAAEHSANPEQRMVLSRSSGNHYQGPHVKRGAATKLSHNL